MTEKYQNKYRIKSARLPHWDYGWNGYYFVTICTQGHTPWFGRVVDGEMVLSDIGISAQRFWNEIPKHFPFVKLDAFVVMPNHVHGIVIIDKENGGHDMGTWVETQDFASLQQTRNKFGPQSKNLASIIRGFKAAVTKRSRIIHPNFAWQPRFHDHIIRSEESYHHIAEYIKYNPAKWADDQFYVE